MTARRRGKIRSEKRGDPSGATRPQDDKGSRPQDDSRLNAAGQERSSQILLFFGVLIVLLHVWGMLQPSHDNWGVHVFGFYGPGISLGSLCIALLLLIPKTQTWLLGFVESGVRFLARLPLIVSIVIVGGIILACAVEFPAKLHLHTQG